jgi:hypothetical protein
VHYIGRSVRVAGFDFEDVGACYASDFPPRGGRYRAHESIQ